MNLRAWVLAGAFLGLLVASGADLALDSPLLIPKGVGPPSATEERSYSSDWWTGRVTLTTTFHDRSTGALLGTRREVIQDGPPLVLIPALVAAGGLAAAGAYSIRRRLAGDLKLGYGDRLGQRRER